jgi:hypothetical protein
MTNTGFVYVVTLRDLNFWKIHNKTNAPTIEAIQPAPWPASPAHGLTQITRDNRTGNSQQGRQNQSYILLAWHDEFRNHTVKKAPTTRR